MLFQACSLSALANCLTFSIVLKSTPVKMFPTNGIAQGPGGKLRGFQFLITSVKSNSKKISKTQLLKSIYAKSFCKIMAQTLLPKHRSQKQTGWSLVCLWIGWRSCISIPGTVLHNTEVGHLAGSNVQTAQLLPFPNPPQVNNEPVRLR